MCLQDATGCNTPPTFIASVAASSVHVLLTESRSSTVTVKYLDRTFAAVKPDTPLPKTTACCLCCCKSATAGSTVCAADMCLQTCLRWFTCSPALRATCVVQIALGLLLTLCIVSCKRQTPQQAHSFTPRLYFAASIVLALTRSATGCCTWSVQLPAL
jgi:hypothetical protein